MTVRSVLIPAVVIACTASALAEEAAQLAVEITEEGEVLVAGRLIPKKELSQELLAFLKKSKDAEVLIIASEKAPLEVMTEVFRILREAEIQKFSLQSR